MKFVRQAKKYFGVPYARKYWTSEGENSEYFDECWLCCADLCAAKDPASEIFLYADDSKIYKVIRNESDQQKLQSVMNLVKIYLMSGFLN